MSTKTIRELIDAVRRGDAPERFVARAEMEIAAIRVAIEAVTAWDHIEIETNDPEEKKQVIEAKRLLRTIAEEGM